MTTIAVGRLTAAGLLALRDHIADTKECDPETRARNARWIIETATHCQPVEGAGSIDLSFRPATLLALAEHVAPAIAPLGEAAVSDAGINGFLTVAFMESVVGKKARIAATYVLDGLEGETSKVRNYRNALFCGMNLYSRHGESGIARRFLLGKPFKLQNALEKLSQAPRVLASRSAVELSALVFLTEKGNFRKPRKQDKDDKTLPGSKAFQVLSAALFSQVSLNYDVERMSVKQLFRLVPETPQLSTWKAMLRESDPNFAPAPAPAFAMAA